MLWVTREFFLFYLFFFLSGGLIVAFFKVLPLLSSVPCLSLLWHALPILICICNLYLICKVILLSLNLSFHLFLFLLFIKKKLGVSSLFFCLSFTFICSNFFALACTFHIICICNLYLICKLILYTPILFFPFGADMKTNTGTIHKNVSWTFRRGGVSSQRAKTFRTPMYMRPFVPFVSHADQTTFKGPPEAMFQP